MVTPVGYRMIAASMLCALACLLVFQHRPARLDVMMGTMLDR
jgi:hypothetical protein